MIHVMRLCEGLSLCTERHGQKSFDTQKCAAQRRRRCVANSAAASLKAGGACLRRNQTDDTAGSESDSDD